MTAKIISLPVPERVADATAFDQSEGQSVMHELRRARIRIAQLEASLSEAMRDSLANFNRARDAERNLEQMRG
jgi:hypothetical protein